METDFFPGGRCFGWKGSGFVLIQMRLSDCLRVYCALFSISDGIPIHPFASRPRSREPFKSRSDLVRSFLIRRSLTVLEVLIKDSLESHAAQDATWFSELSKRGGEEGANEPPPQHRVLNRQVVGGAFLQLDCRVRQ